MKFSTGFTLLGAVFSVKADEECYLPLDVMFLQDTTGSFDDDLPNVEAQIPDMVDTILALHPNSWFGVAEFKDKPYYPLGETSDFCYKLGDGKLSGDMSDFQWAYSLLYASGGGDLPEAQYQALINLAYDPAVGWRKLADASSRAEEGEAGARLVIMSTDALPHLPGDIDHYPAALFPDLPRNLGPNSGIISTGDVDYECLFQDYPTLDQMKAAVKAANFYLVILTPEDPEIVAGWKWVNEQFLGQPAGFYQFISEDSSDLLDGVLRALAAVTEYACPSTTASPTTPTPFPSLPPPVTQPPTTTTEATTTTTTTTEATTTTTTTTAAPTTTTTTTTAPTTTITTTTTAAPTTTTTAAPTTTTTTPEAPTVTPVGSTEAVECPTCPPGTDPCPPCVPCPDPCNHGVKVYIGGEVESAVIDIA